LAKEHLVKNWLISTLRQGNLLQTNKFFRGIKNLSSLQKIGLRSAEKNSPFFKHASSGIALRISMEKGCCGQGDQIGRIFVYPVIVYFFKITEVAKIFGYFL
jgi:hypothetical protein